jgi:hypothetical protein
LYDTNEKVCGTWDYLIHAKASEIRQLPIGIRHMDDCPELCQEAKWLIGWWFHKAGAAPANAPSAWNRNWNGLSLFWGTELRERIARTVDIIDHWKITHGEYFQIPNQRASWFIDAPYDNPAGEHYTHGRDGIDYHHLGVWCKDRQGQTIVCEGPEARWLDFRPFLITHGQRHNTQEMIWTNDPLAPSGVEGQIAEWCSTNLGTANDIRRALNLPMTEAEVLAVCEDLAKRKLVLGRDVRSTNFIGQYSSERQLALSMAIIPNE